MGTGGDSKRNASATRDPAPVLSGSQTTAASTCPADSMGSSTPRKMVANCPQDRSPPGRGGDALVAVGPTISSEEQIRLLANGPD